MIFCWFPCFLFISIVIFRFFLFALCSFSCFICLFSFVFLSSFLYPPAGRFKTYSERIAENVWNPLNPVSVGTPRVRAPHFVFPRCHDADPPPGVVTSRKRSNNAIVRKTGKSWMGKPRKRKITCNRPMSTYLERPSAEAPLPPVHMFFLVDPSLCGRIPLGWVAPRCM